MTEHRRLRPAWYRVNAPAPGAVSTIRNGDTEFVLFAGDDGLGALDAWCPHRGAHMEAGSVDDRGLVCPLHGWCWGADGANLACGDGDPHPEARATALPTGGTCDHPLVWLGSGGPDHEPIDLAAGLPADPAVDLEFSVDLGDVDPALVIENAFDAAHVPVVHDRPAITLGEVEIDGDRARIDHHDPERNTTTRFDAYRASQMLVRIGTARPDMELWVLFAVVAGPTTVASLRYVTSSSDAEGALTRFSRLHRRELERDLRLFASQRPEKGRWWGPHDDALRTYRTWIDGFSS